MRTWFRILYQNQIGKIYLDREGPLKRLLPGCQLGSVLRMSMAITFSFSFSLEPNVPTDRTVVADGLHW